MHSRPHITPAAAAILAVLLGALLLLALAGCQSTSDDSAEAAAVDVYSPFGLYGPGTLYPLPTSATETVLSRMGMKSLGEFHAYSRRLVQELGVSWARIDFTYDGWNFFEPSDHIVQLHAGNIDMVGTILPINPYVPGDLTAFQEKVRDLIRRYPWVAVWQIGNEPDLTWENPGDYPRLFFAAQQVVREECPQCKVALAGAGARWPGQDYEGWRRSLDVYDDIIGQIADQAGEDKKPFDILDMHYYDFYGTDEAMLQTMDDYRSLIGKYGLGPDIEFWVTETATPTGALTWPPDSPDQTEEQQASELVTRFVTMLNARVARVAWARMYENYRYLDTEGGFFDHSGIVYNGLGTEAAAGIKPGTEKLAFTTYQIMTRMLAGCAHVHRLNAGSYRFDFDEEGRPSVYILWDAAGPKPPAEISGPVRVTDIRGQTIEATGEQLELGAEPLFVEKVPAGGESTESTVTAASRD